MAQTPPPTTSQFGVPSEGLHVLPRNRLPRNVWVMSWDYPARPVKAHSARWCHPERNRDGLRDSLTHKHWVAHGGLPPCPTPRFNLV